MKENKRYMTLEVATTNDTTPGATSVVDLNNKELVCMAMDEAKAKLISDLLNNYHESGKVQ